MKYIVQSPYTHCHILFLQCFDTVGWVIWPIKPVPNMTYNVSGGALNLAQSTAILRLSGFCPGQPGWASTRRNIHSLTPVVVISHPLSASSIYYDPWHPLCSIYVPDSLFPQSLSKFSLVYLLACTLHFILHTFLHPLIVFFLQHMWWKGKQTSQTNSWICSFGW